MASNIACPMHPKPYPPCDADGTCQLCGRSWSLTKDGDLRSAKRAVKIVGEIKAGANINDIIKPTTPRNDRSGDGR